MMKRRQFLTKTAGMAAVGATTSTALAKPAIANGKRTVKMVTTWPKNFPGLGVLAERIAQSITALTNERITIKVFAAGELVPALESFDAVSTGAADLYHAADYYWQAKSPAYAFFTGIPFGLTASEMDAWVLFGGGQDLWDELAMPFNIKPILAGNTGQQMGGWFNRDLQSLDDFKGLKIRMPGLGGEVFRKLGATAVTLPGHEIFSSMKSGAIDATDWIGPWNDLAFGLNRVGKYYFHPGFHEPSGALCLGCNLEFWESLSRTDQKAIETVGLAENNRSLAEFRHESVRALESLRNDPNVELRRYSDDILSAFAIASQEILNDLAQKDAMTKKVADSFLAFRDKAIDWATVADEEFLAARRTVLR